MGKRQPKVISHRYDTCWLDFDTTKSKQVCGVCFCVCEKVKAKSNQKQKQKQRQQCNRKTKSPLKIRLVHPRDSEFQYELSCQAHRKRSQPGSDWIALDRIIGSYRSPICTIYVLRRLYGEQRRSHVDKQLNVMPNKNSK